MLDFEEHVFRIMENHVRISDYLKPRHDWRFDMDAGRLSFVARKGGRLLASCPVQIIGTISWQTRTWLWAWANKSSAIPSHLLRYAATLVAQAGKDKKKEFLETASFALESSSDPDRLAVVVSGYSKMFGYYKCPYEGGCLYVGVESFPEANQNPRDVQLVQRTITTAITAFEFDHHTAMVAYLGQPLTTDGPRMTWHILGQVLQIDFDDLGRIVNIQ